MTTTEVMSPDLPDLDSMSRQALLDLFNSKVPEDQRLKTFKDKATAIRRVREVLTGTVPVKAPRVKKAPASMPKDGPEPVIADAAEPKAKKTRKIKPQGEDSGRRRAPLDVKPSTRIKPHREGTKRAEAIILLTKGATLEQVMEKIGWDRRTCVEGIKLLHKHLGYGLSEDDKGVIRLVLPAAK